MDESQKKNPMAMWLGAAISAALLVFFLILKLLNSNALDLPPQWLLVSIAPVIIGLIVGGYVRELKAGDYGMGFAADEILSKSKPVSDSSPANSSKSMTTPSSGDWQSERAKEYARTHGYMLVHIYRPSRQAGQKFNISVFVVQHKKGTLAPPRENLSEIQSAEFFFGESWGNQVFETRGDGGFFGVRTHAWGTFLATCRITFKNSRIEPIILNRYVDFSMTDP